MTGHSLVNHRLSDNQGCLGDLLAKRISAAHCAKPDELRREPPSHILTAWHLDICAIGALLVQHEAG